MALPTGAKVFNVIRDDMNQVYMNTLPSATATNIGDIKNVLFGDNYQPMLNDFVNSLVNRIGLTMIETKSFNNPLSILKKGAVPLGTDVQQIYENPAVAEQYGNSNTEMAKLLTKTEPDTKVVYFRRNRQDLYTKTIAREDLQGAFVSWEQFESFIQGIVTSLYSGNYIDEFKYTKQLVTQAVEGEYAKEIALTGAATATDLEEAVILARTAFLNMTLPSTDYNAYATKGGKGNPVTTWTEPDRIVFIATSEFMAHVDVKVLAEAFNMDKTNFMGRVITVDAFPDTTDGKKIHALMCDEAFFQIYDNVFRFDEFYNARTMTWNEYLHAWGTWQLSPLANAVAFVTKG